MRNELIDKLIKEADAHTSAVSAYQAGFCIEKDIFADTLVELIMDDVVECISTCLLTDTQMEMLISQLKSKFGV